MHSDCSRRRRTHDPKNDERLSILEAEMSVYLVQKLRARHHSLEREIQEELQKPLPDPLRIAEVKREKLLVKDRIVRVMREEEFAPAY